MTRFFYRLRKHVVEKKKSSLPFAKSYEKLHLTTLRGFLDKREKFLSDILQIINPLTTQYDQTNLNKKKNHKPRHMTTRLMTKVRFTQHCTSN